MLFRDLSDEYTVGILLKTVIFIAAAIIQQESQESSVCTIFVGEDDIINADQMDATSGQPNHQGPHSRVAYNSAAIATFEEPTVRCLQEFTSSGASGVGGMSGISGNSGIGDISGVSGIGGAENVLSPLENINRKNRESASKAIQGGFNPFGACKRPEKKRRRQLRFENDNMQENGYIPSGSHIREGTDRIRELLIKEAEKRVEHYTNLCREDEERLASFREKEQLEMNYLKIKLQLAKKQLDKEGY